MDFLQTKRWHRNTIRGRLLELGEVQSYTHQAFKGLNLLPIMPEATREAGYNAEWMDCHHPTDQLFTCRHEADCTIVGFKNGP